MKSKVGTCYIIVFSCFAFLLLINGCETNPIFSTPEKKVKVESGPILKKPNIYLYPESDLHLSVRIEFPLGGEITQSDPEYRGGWDVFVDTEGIINHQHSCLFYECVIPVDVFQRTEGWVVEQKDLTEFFEVIWRNMDSLKRRSGIFWNIGYPFWMRRAITRYFLKVRK